MKAIDLHEAGANVVLFQFNESIVQESPIGIEHCGGQSLLCLLPILSRFI
jgi:hypothetical protein